MSLLTPLSVLVIIGACVAALAWFSAIGGSSVTLSSSTLQPIAVIDLAAGDSPASVLLPGTSADAIMRVSNPNSMALTVMSIVQSGPSVASGSISGCPGGVVTVTAGAGAGLVVDPGTWLLHVPSAVRMATDAPPACAGASFSIPADVVVRS